jgi:gamma-glutamyl-gamma-aminobutyrate hydrolase PuuD
MSKVFVECNDTLTTRMFVEEGWDVVGTVEEADLVCFTGGADVNPLLYGERNTASHCDSDRDLRSISLYLAAFRNDLPCVGICRGGQFLNVMNGGKMIQHIDGHAINGTHLVTISSRQLPDFKDISFQATSTHHQEMVPNRGMFDDILLEGKSEEGVQEVIWYEVHLDLCFQPHPEYPGGEDCRVVFFQLIKELIE